MSLQTRLAALISAIGADIKADRARLTTLEGAPGRTAYRGMIQSAAGYANLGATRPTNAAQRVDLTVEAGTYIVHASMSAYHTAVTGAPWNVRVRLADGVTVLTPVVSAAFYLNQANVHYTAPPVSGEIVVPTAGTISIWPDIGGLTTTADDRFDVVLIPKSSGGPPGPKGDTGSTGVQGPAGDAPASYTMDTWKQVGAVGQPAYQNSWTLYPGEGAWFRKDPFGVVKCRGVVTGGTMTAPIFTLPVGYRPPRQMVYLVQAGTGTAAMIIGTNGSVFVNNYFGTGSNAYVYLDEVEFDTDLVTTFLAGPKGDKGDIGLPPIIVKANRTTTAALTPTVVTRIAFPNEISDDSNIFDGQVFQPTRAGWYRITGSLFVDSLTGTNSLLSLYLVKNSTGHNYPSTGTLETQDNKMTYPAQSEINAVLDVDQLVYFNGTTDFVEFYAAFSVSGRVGTGSTWFQAESIGAVGPAGPTGATGAVGPAGADGADIVQQIDWTLFDVRDDGTGYDADPDYPPQWMISADGIVHLRGRAMAHLGSTGIGFWDPSTIYQPALSDGGAAQTWIAGVNQTQEKIGAWEILGSAMLWHGDAAEDDFIGLDGISYPSGGGPLGKLVVPTLAGGITSDPTDPLIVYSNGKQIRVMGTVQGSIAGGGAFTNLFTVAGLAVANHSIVANARGTTVSGPQHPTTSGLDEDDWQLTSAGVLRVRSLLVGTNVMKVWFNGLFSTPEME